MRLNKYHLNYPSYSFIQSIDSYKYPSDGKEWLPCPRCGLTPKIWEWDNGRRTVCGCARNEYDHWSIHAESINSYISRKRGSTIGYDNDELRKNWNHYCRTGKIKFNRVRGKTFSFGRLFGFRRKWG